MSRRRLVKLSDVWAMLAVCASGYSQRKTDHHYRVTFNKKLYPSLPRGPHGAGDKEIEFGHVLKMAKFFALWSVLKKCSVEDGSTRYRG